MLQKDDKDRSPADFCALILKLHVYWFRGVIAWILKRDLFKLIQGWWIYKEILRNFLTPMVSCLGYLNSIRFQMGCLFGAGLELCALSNYTCLPKHGAEAGLLWKEICLSLGFEPVSSAPLPAATMALLHTVIHRLRRKLFPEIASMTITTTSGATKVATWFTQSRSVKF